MRLYRAIKNRGPVAAALMTILFSPIIGMLYLNKGILALIYLATLFVVSFAIEFYGDNILPQMSSENIDLTISIIFMLIGTIHAVIIAKRRDKDSPLRWFSKIIPPFTILFIVILIPAILIRTLIAEPINIPSGSMEPNLSVGDVFISRKAAYGYSQYTTFGNLKLWDGIIAKRAPKRGDIALFDLPEHPNATYVKRVIGMPGDTIQFIQNTIHINGSPLPLKQIEDYQSSTGKTLRQFKETLPNGVTYNIIHADKEAPAFANTEEITIAPDHYFMVGDNRNNSQDSRAFGAVPHKYLIGKPLFYTYDGKTGAISFKKVQ